MEKTKLNPFYNSAYVELPTMIELLEPLLDEHGMYLEQPQEIREGIPCQVSRIVDIETGEFKESYMPLPTDVNAQGVCQATTYYSRYTLRGLLALKWVEDDDGNFSSNKSNRKTSPNKSRGGGRKGGSFNSRTKSSEFVTEEDDY